MATKVVQRLPYFTEIPNQMIFYSSRSSKGKNNSVFKKCLDCHRWKAKYKIDPPILSPDQMLLHCNESGSQKSLNFSGSDQSCFVKENYHLTQKDPLWWPSLHLMQSKLHLLSLYLREKESELKSIHQSAQLHKWVIKAPIELNMFWSTLKHCRLFLFISPQKNVLFWLLAIIQLISSKKWKRFIK